MKVQCWSGTSRFHEGSNWVRNLSIPWRNKWLSGTFWFHEGINVRQESLDSMKVQSWTWTSRFRGRNKFDVICCSGTSPLHKGSKSNMNLLIPWEVQGQCHMSLRNHSIPWRFKVGYNPPDSMGGSSWMSNVVQELLNLWKLKNWRWTLQFH